MDLFSLMGIAPTAPTEEKKATPKKEAPKKSTPTATPKEEKKWLEVIKLILLTCIVFIGASFTIMTFNTDVSVTDVFDHVYMLVTGTEKTKGSVLEIAYCVGVFVGILGFYNHFNDEKINCLMIYNARTDTVYYVKIADIDKAVFEFVNDAAEKQSKKNEQVLKLLGIKLK